MCYIVYNIFRKQAARSTVSKFLRQYKSLLYLLYTLLNVQQKISLHTIFKMFDLQPIDLKLIRGQKNVLVQLRS